MQFRDSAYGDFNANPATDRRTGGRGSGHPAGQWDIVMITRRCFNALAAAFALASGIAAKRANALAWPTHPVRIVVPFAAGGPTDVIARIVGERLSKSWGQQVLIENRPGGGTNIANELVARWEPDGHTVLMSGSLARADETIE